MAAEMNDRRELVLKLVIQEFIENPLTPVASELLVRKYGMNVSSATIRNEMAALEDLGYLTHSHTSAGRVPTSSGRSKSATTSLRSSGACSERTGVRPAWSR